MRGRLRTITSSSDGEWTTISLSGGDTTLARLAAPIVRFVGRVIGLSPGSVAKGIRLVSIAAWLVVGYLLAFGDGGAESNVSMAVIGGLYVVLGGVDIAVQYDAIRRDLEANSTTVQISRRTVRHMNARSFRIVIAIVFPLLLLPSLDGIGVFIAIVLELIAAYAATTIGPPKRSVFADAAQSAVALFRPPATTNAVRRGRREPAATS